MATMNPFDLLGDDDAEDPSLLVAAQQQKLAAAPKKALSGQAQPNKPGLDAKPAKLPSKPAPPSQAGELLIFGLLLYIYFSVNGFCS